MLAFLVSSSEGRGVFSWNRYMSDNIPAIAISAILAAASVYSIICAILVVLPRKNARTTTLFWGAWHIHKDRFLVAAENRDADYLFQQYVDNVSTLSEIARAKYRFVGLAFRGLVITVLAFVLLPIVT